MPCTNHPQVETGERCAGCGQPFCPSCVVEFLGRHYCGPCRDFQLTQVQPPASLVFSPERRRRGAIVAGGLMLAVILTPALLALAVLRALVPVADASFVLFVAVGALIVGLACGLAMVPQIELLGNEGLRRDMAAKIADGGMSQAVEEGLFVGISPGMEQRSYDGDTHWDVGFLFLQPGWLAYYGDQVRFALRPDQVQRVEVHHPGFGQLIESWLRVHWRDPEAGLEGILSLSFRGGRGRRERRKALEDLRRRIEAWKGAVAPSPSIPVPLPPASVLRGNPLPAALTAPGTWLLLGVPLAILAGISGSILERMLGLGKPAMAGLVITVTLLLLGFLVQAIEHYRQQRRR
jgi:hypothetical protein